MSFKLSPCPPPEGVADPGLVGYPDEIRAAYRAAGLWSGRSLPVELVAAAAKHAGRVALVTAEATMTYGQLFSAAARLAGGLIASTDLRPGDAVMFQMGNVAETVLAYLGCLLAGLRPVGTLPQHGEREIALLARHIGARGLLAQADFGRRNLAANPRTLRDSGAVTTVVVFRGPPSREPIPPAHLLPP